MRQTTAWSQGQRGYGALQKARKNVPGPGYLGVQVQRCKKTETRFASRQIRGQPTQASVAATHASRLAVGGPEENPGTHRWRALQVQQQISSLS